MKCKLCTILLLCLPFLCSAQLSWHELTNAPHTYRHDDIYFLNPQKGWAINAVYQNETPPQLGQIWTTDDGGATWTKIFDSSLSYIRCVGFADVMHGWFGNLAEAGSTNDTNAFYQTSDGGHTWSVVTNITGTKPVGICGISVVTDSVIYAYGRVDGPPRFMKTTNLGFSWTSVDLSAYAKYLIDAWFFDKDTGIVVGAIDSPSKAVVLSTFDGGATWQTRFTSTTIFETCWKVSFPSRNIGYASIECGLGQEFSIPPPDTTYFLKTTDGGLTWSKNIFSTTFYDEQGCGFINDTVGWIGGDPSIAKTFKTTDGGATWAVDNTLGVEVPVYNGGANGVGYSINRFRRFGDTLMYASGRTVYKYDASTAKTINTHANNGEYTIYPNPASGKVYIEGADKGAELKVYDETGRLLMSITITDKKQAIDISRFAPGAYFFNLSGSKGEASTKIVVKE